MDPEDLQIGPEDLQIGPEDLQITEEFLRANGIRDQYYNLLKINQILADTFDHFSFMLTCETEWLRVLRYIPEPIFAIIHANPPAPLHPIPVKELTVPWPKIESVYDRVNGTAGAQAWVQYYPQEYRTQDCVRDAGWRGRQWARIADKAGAGLLYAIGCSRGDYSWDMLSDIESDLVLAWIETRPKLLAYCLDLTSMMAKMLRGQESEQAKVWLRDSP
ncbi:hypothetical protein BDZ91DRAFT_764974 [Kalaharituber pfeilii]|nr:hypothetical protein BDZ91DRAFT_764974 [Kalaharituber pfeilii]